MTRPSVEEYIARWTARSGPPTDQQRRGLEVAYGRVGRGVPVAVVGGLLVLASAVAIALQPFLIAYLIGSGGAGALVLVAGLSARRTYGASLAGTLRTAALRHHALLCGVAAVVAALAAFLVVVGIALSGGGVAVFVVLALAVAAAVGPWLAR